MGSTGPRAVHEDLAGKSFRFGQYLGEAVWVHVDTT